MKHILAFVVCFLGPAVFSAEPAVSTGEILLYPGEVRTVKAWVENPSRTHPFLLSSIEKTCGCVSVNGMPDRLQAGERSRITADVVGASDVERKNVGIRFVGLTDEKPTALPLTFRIRVEDYLLPQESNPWGAQTLLTSQAHPGSFEKTISCSRGAHPAPWVRTTAQITGTSDTWTVTGTYLTYDIAFRPATGAIGVYSATVQLTFFDGEGTQLPYRPTLPVKAIVQGPVSSSPSELILGPTLDGLTSDGEITFAVDHGNPVPVDIMASDPRVTIERVDGRHAVHLTFHAAPPLGKANGYVDVVFAAGIIRVPYLASVVGKK